MPVAIISKLKTFMGELKNVKWSGKHPYFKEHLTSKKNWNVEKKLWTWVRELLKGLRNQEA